MIVRAGGLTLHAPDVMPDGAAEHVAALGALLVQTATASPDTDVSEAVRHIAALEGVAFGRRHAGRLRRCGSAARKSACRQLLGGWGQFVDARMSPC